MKFIETITLAENDVMVPIDRIKYVWLTYDHNWKVCIKSDDGEWSESFGTLKEARTRYDDIAEILNSKD